MGLHGRRSTLRIRHGSELFELELMDRELWADSRATERLERVLGESAVVVALQSWAPLRDRMAAGPAPLRHVLRESPRGIHSNDILGARHQWAVFGGTPQQPGAKAQSYLQLFLEESGF